MRLKSEKEKKGGVFKKSRPIHNYIDAAARTIALPHVFKKELMKNKAEQKFFDTLSFTNNVVEDVSLCCMRRRQHPVQYLSIF